MAAKKNFYDWSTFSGFGNNAFGLLSNSVRAALSFDSYSGKKQFEAIVLTDALFLSREERYLADSHGNKGTHSMAGAGTSQGSGISADDRLPFRAFKYKARIIGNDSPHSFLPDPCDPDWIVDPNEAYKVIALHTDFYAQGDLGTELNQTPPVKGNVVTVELSFTGYSYDLQRGKHVNILGGHRAARLFLGRTHLNATEDGTPQDESCQRLFDDDLPDVEIPWDPVPGDCGTEPLVDMPGVVPTTCWRNGPPLPAVVLPTAGYYQMYSGPHQGAPKGHTTASPFGGDHSGVDHCNAVPYKYQDDDGVVHEGYRKQGTGAQYQQDPDGDGIDRTTGLGINRPGRWEYYTNDNHTRMQNDWSMNPMGQSPLAKSPTELYPGVLNASDYAEDYEYWRQNLYHEGEEHSVSANPHRFWPHGGSAVTFDGYTHSGGDDTIHPGLAESGGGKYGGTVWDPRPGVTPTHGRVSSDYWSSRGYGPHKAIDIAGMYSEGDDGEDGGASGVFENAVKEACPSCTKGGQHAAGTGGSTTSGLWADGTMQWDKSTGWKGAVIAIQAGFICAIRNDEGQANITYSTGHLGNYVEIHHDLTFEGQRRYTSDNTAVNLNFSSDTGGESLLYIMAHGSGSVMGTWDVDGDNDLTNDGKAAYRTKYAHLSNVAHVRYMDKATMVAETSNVLEESDDDHGLEAGQKMRPDGMPISESDWYPLQLGMYVKRGQIIGRIGSTGRSTGPHLHLELETRGTDHEDRNRWLRRDPLLWFGWEGLYFGINDRSEKRSERHCKYSTHGSSYSEADCRSSAGSWIGKIIPRGMACGNSPHGGQANHGATPCYPGVHAGCPPNPYLGRLPHDHGVDAWPPSTPVQAEGTTARFPYPTDCNWRFEFRQIAGGEEFMTNGGHVDGGAIQNGSYRQHGLRMEALFQQSFESHGGLNVEGATNAGYGGRQASFNGYYWGADGLIEKLEINTLSMPHDAPYGEDGEYHARPQLRGQAYGSGYPEGREAYFSWSFKSQFFIGMVTRDPDTKIACPWAQVLGQKCNKDFSTPG